jgi:L-2-hydroxyglutarate oxidase
MPDVLVVGGGIVGLATAERLSREGVRVTVLEAADRLGAHQTGRNSGVIHSGLYYAPGSLKAELCVRGRAMMEELCSTEGVAWERTGKLVVAVEEAERARLDELEQRGRANGLAGIERLDAHGVKEVEPECRALEALWIPETGITNYLEVSSALARRIEARGGHVILGSSVSTITTGRGAVEVTDRLGRSFTGAVLVGCAGAQSDRLARAAGLDPGLQIVPFRGEYCELLPPYRHLVRGLIYPVPDPNFPFLGVHTTRMLDGRIEAGPNAVLAFRRDGYRFTDLGLHDLLETVTHAGFRRLARRHWRTGLGEMYRSVSLGAFARALSRLVPAVGPHMLRRTRAGIRAQAIDATGALVDDFRVLREAGMVHVLNAPSPAATASLAIGDRIAAWAHEALAERGGA